MEPDAEPRSDDHMDMIEAYIEHVRRTSRSGSDATVQRRREVITLLNRELPRGVGDTSQEELEDWLHDSLNHFTGKPLSQNTKSTYWNAIRGAYKFWADPKDPWIDVDPTADMDPIHGLRGSARDITDEQLWDLLARAREPYRLWALIAAYQGLRCIEISGLHRDHVTADRLIVVRGKGGKARVHDTDPLVWEAVEQLPPGPVARDIWGRDRASAYYISRMASAHFQAELGLEGVTMHRLRHWLGVRTQALYRDVRVTQEVLGHETLSATQIYTRATVDQQRAARAMLPRPHAG